MDTGFIAGIRPYTDMGGWGSESLKAELEDNRRYQSTENQAHSAVKVRSKGKLMEKSVGNYCLSGSVDEAGISVKQQGEQSGGRV